MARSIDDIYNLMRFIVQKERGVFITIPEAMETLDSYQLDYYEVLFKDFSRTQRIHDGLSPFRVVQPFTANAGGDMAFQPDYMHFTGNLAIIINGILYKVKLVNDDEWADATRSQLRPPSATSAIAKDIASGWQLCPFSPLVGQYDYLRRPATPVLGLNVSGRTLTYDPTTSVQLEWRDNYVNPVIFGALSHWSIDMNDDKLVQYTEMQKAQIQEQTTQPL